MPHPPDPEVIREPSPRRGHVSVVRLPDQWFVLATSSQLRDRPLPAKLQGVPVVLFRDVQGRPAALLDRCPHRNVPLSLGRVYLGQIECPYHGWRFDRGGACRFVPSLCGEHEGKARRTPSLAAVELDGFIWVYSTPDKTPTSEPYRFRMLGHTNYTHIRQVVAAEASLYSTAENALDVPHTAFLHRGLFRSESRGITITAVVRRKGDRVEAEYIGEPRPPGLVGRLLSPSGGMVTHVDRFLLPSIVEVEYRMGTENHVLVASALTPVDDFFTQVFTLVSFRTRLPGSLLAPLLTPIATRIFRQDAYILRQQTATIRQFGGEQFVSTEIDVLGKHIWRLLRAAERGEIPREDSSEETRIPLVV
ncbi:MAG: Rieske 2Fe-2S domain-containing protein [Myxococcales bacterium]|nr:Rieske 2Fe-2S domain-containing protein [Polyangiaceae bacterium]MDW8247907.1 Rieske 2Fe-2S domain-containing protein [Myxococcales bacterium]